MLMYTFRISVCVAPVLSWILNSKRSFIGSWTLPIGLLFFWICLLSILVGLHWWVREKKGYTFFILVINVCLLFGDFRLRFPSNEGTPILTWNIEGKAIVNSPQQQCALRVLQDWGEDNPRGILVLQEVRHFQKKIFAEELNRNCIWSPYHKKKEQLWHRNGLMVCVDQMYWSVHRPHHRDYAQQSSYGFLQMEITEKSSQTTYNIMNVHLESLYTTARQSDDFNVIKGSVTDTFLSFMKSGEFGKIFLLLSRNSQAQEKQLKEIKTVLRQLKDPTIIAGDFNSPPEQWHHRNLRIGYQDAHRATGYGFGATVQRFGFIQSRVDYLYASKELQWSGTTKVHEDILCSDHYPTSSIFDLYQ
jgi:endonuclease/exonuclease/phosphatase family metal-dependent hydrolase